MVWLIIMGSLFVCCFMNQFYSILQMGVTNKQLEASTLCLFIWRRGTKRYSEKVELCMLNVNVLKGRKSCCLGSGVMRVDVERRGERHG